jgi:hypothetical protein
LPEDISSVERRLDALEQTTNRQLQDARDIHRREHDTAEAAHQQVHRQQAETGAAMLAMYEERFRLEEKARDTATMAMDKRLEGMNEFRDQLRDQQGTFVRREVYDALEVRVTNIEKGDIKGEGKALGQGTVIAVIVGAVAFVGAILGIIVVVVNIATGS